jgi:hypothetical protein
MPDQTLPRPGDDFIKKNVFRKQVYKHREMLSFGEAKTRLPVPVIPDNPEWVEMYWRAWEIAWSNLRRPKPSSNFVSNYMSPVDSDHIHMWESAFITQFGLYGRRAFDFQGTMNNFYAKQHDDGFICRQIDQENGRDLFRPFEPDSTGPPIFSWAEWRYYRQTGDSQRLVDVFWPLLSYYRWFRANRTWPNGLYWATGLSSGMSNQNRVPDGLCHHCHWAWVDATMQGAIDSQILSNMALLLDLREVAEELAGEHMRILDEANIQLWDEEEGFYLDAAPDGHYSPVFSIGAYWALLDSKMVSGRRLELFLQHLRDGDAFQRPHQLPSMSAVSEGYDAETGNRWQGGVWSPTNYMVLKGLDAVDQKGLAHKIAYNHLENIATVFERTDTFWEHYAPEEAAPGQGAKADYVGWTGLSPIAILIEDIIGLQSNWPSRQVSWQRRYKSDSFYGVRNYPLGADGWLDIEGDNEKITVKTTVPFTLLVQDEEKSLQMAVPVGTTEIT